MILHTLVHRAQGMRQAALETLQQAVALASKEGYKQPFLEDLSELRPLLLAIQPLNNTFVAGLLGEAHPSLAQHAQPELPDPLNEREVEILRLIAAGLSNPEIARELYLALNTVKWYAKRIFQKLDVTSRKEAAARAGDLGLLR